MQSITGYLSKAISVLKSNIADEPNHVRIQQFNISYIPSSEQFFVICGRKQSGKTALILDLLQQRGLYKEVILYTKEAQSPLVPVATRINDKFEWPEFKRLYRKAPSCGKDRLAIIFELESLDWIRRITKTGRHYGIDIYLIADHLLSLPPDIMSNVDYYMAAECHKWLQGLDMQRMDRSFNYIYEIGHIYGAITCEPQTFLVIDNQTLSAQIEDNCFWHKVKSPFAIPNSDAKQNS